MDDIIRVTNARLDVAINKAKKRIAASIDERVLEKGGQTVCSVVESLKQKAKLTAKSKPKQASKPKAKRAIAGTKKRADTKKENTQKKKPPCADVSTARKLIRCLDRCCAKSKKMTATPQRGALKPS
jgi:hypothetical protein